MAWDGYLTLDGVEIINASRTEAYVALQSVPWFRATVRNDALPVLLDPYGGPHALRVVQSSNAFLTSQWFTDQGFAVVVTDGRGTPGRGSQLDVGFSREGFQVWFKFNDAFRTRRFGASRQVPMY